MKENDILMGILSRIYKIFSRKKYSLLKNQKKLTTTNLRKCQYIYVTLIDYNCEAELSWILTIL